MQRVTALLTATAVIMTGATLGTDAQTRRDRFRMHGETDTEQTPSVDARGAQLPAPRTTEAPTGFDNETNGFLRQGPPFETIDEDNVVPLRSFNDNRFIFEEVEVVADGLGPIYNAQSCGECHQNVATGGASQIAEHRTGRLMGDEFFESLGGSLVHSRATHPDIVEPVVYEDSIRTFRISTNTLGAGYVEAIANTTLLRIREEQPAALRGSVALAPVLEAEGQPRIGRFGWKNQHSSLLSFAADAYLNEMGITSPLFPTENTSSGRDVSAFDPVRRSGGRRRRHRGVRGFHACDEGTVTRSDRRGGSGRRNDLQEHRLRDVSRTDARDVAARHSDQRRQVHRS